MTWLLTDTDGDATEVSSATEVVALLTATKHRYRDKDKAFIRSWMQTAVAGDALDLPTGYLIRITARGFGRLPDLRESPAFSGG